MAPMVDDMRRFAGSVPEVYDRLMVPMIFDPYAIEVASRVAELHPARVLEIAAGTGAVTRRLADVLPPSTEIVATDLNQPMLDRAIEVGTSRSVTWQQADVTALPFEDNAFDCAVCQFGVMFFPDKPAAFAEIRRVLRPGSTFIFAVWDRIDTSWFANDITATLAVMLPELGDSFINRIPHGYFDEGRIRADLAAGGFTTAATVDVVVRRSRAASARDAAEAYCLGTPIRNQIEGAAPERLDEAVDRATGALVQRYGDAEVDGEMSALIVTVTAPT